MPGVVFERELSVRFGHCDPAGIVFYPRYFEMLNELVEDWFAQGLGIPFAQLIGERRIGMPTAQLDTRFRRVSRIGDRLRQRLSLVRLGGSSLTLAIAFDGDDGTRVEFDQVLVCTSLDTHKPHPLPADLRAALERAQETP
ncbi:acyl-CoA thioesterase [Roseateles saccharophilus]|uniref:4-hydroxybenzoyl-CoA thioesterase n=1 Tax=Roseateles saccharophilus TaxID=304 RepID=A0A4R3UGG9_ROSSA|nr:thioesterase family protein [Roseateles saccharophilus]MDG0835252.1 acyl-CoA thioesterase [Roseateles saccharophilus]TCU86856.1 4-hydroxybenzoyl-CoA thioesterase [Roseateles saccharophilus]